MGKIKRLGLLALVLVVVWAVAQLMSAVPVLGFGIGWALLGYLVSRAWPSVRRDLSTLRHRSRRVFVESSAGELL